MVLNKRNACFTCTTPYQLMEAIAIVQNTQIEADLYLFGMFDRYEEVAERLKKYHIFHHVIPVDCRVTSRTDALLQVVLSKRTVSAFLAPNVSYDYFYSSSRAHAKLLLQHELRRRNLDIKYVMFEDGLGSYTKESSVLNTSRLRRLVERLLGWHSFEPDRTSIMVTHPELLELPDALANIHVSKMEPFCWSQSNRDMLLDLFSVKNSDLIRERVVLFDVTRGTYKNDLGMNLAQMDECYRRVVDCFSLQDVICKAHPRSKAKPGIALREYLNIGVPMEILYAGMEDLEERILIGTFSTALFSPKMMFGKEPVIISLHRIVWPGNVAIVPAFEKLSSMYQNKARVVAPQTIEEFTEYLRRL